LAVSTTGSYRRAGNGYFTLGSAALLAGGAFIVHEWSKEGGLLPSLSAAGKGTPQPSAISETKQHAVYIWINVKDTADAKAVAKAAAKLQNVVDDIVPPKEADEDDEILAGVAFGPGFYNRVTKGKGGTENFTHCHRKCPLGEMPSSGGDVFVHAKSHNRGNLFELTKEFLRSLPKDSVASVEDIYGFVYKNGRDMSGFVDGTENPADEEHRAQVGLNTKGGSYLVTQKWIHDFDCIHNTKDKVMEGWVGRTREDSIELKNKPGFSHVARMVGTTVPNQPKPFELVRQSQPYGCLSGEAGLFFIGYAASPANLDFMLDRMVGVSDDGLCDHIMKLTKCVKSTYWYMPGHDEIKAL
jgi:putative iron-dependent peroxidase